MMSTPASGLYAVAIQLWPPAVLGQTETHCNTSAVAMSAR